MPGPMDEVSCCAYLDRTQKHKSAIPPELSFEKVVSDMALSPCSLQDFLDFSKYIAHDAENLQFYCWYQDYVKRFYDTQVADQALSPPYVRPLVVRKNTTTAPAGTSPKRDAIHSANVTGVANKTDAGEGSSSSMAGASSHETGSTRMSSFSDRYQSDGLPGAAWNPHSVQPFREEVDLVIQYYFTLNAVRELNLTQRDKEAVVRAAQHTTHPSAFGPAIDIVEKTLCHQSHPNFIRWSICNGNKPRIYFIKRAGGVHLFLGLVCGLLLAFSHASRWYRWFAFPFFLIGFISLIAAHNGLCVILHVGHRRTLHPWEELHYIAPQVNDSDESFIGDTGDIEMAVFSHNSLRRTSRAMRYSATLDLTSILNPFGGDNKFQDEAWVTAYNGRSWYKRICPNMVRIQNKSIRMLQDRIIVQSLVYGTLAAGILIAGIIEIPILKLY